MLACGRARIPKVNDDFTNPWFSLQSDMTSLSTPIQNQLMHLYLPICTYLGLNAKVSVGSHAANNAAYGCVFVSVTRDGTDLFQAHYQTY